MKTLNVLAASLLAASLVAFPVAFSAEPAKKPAAEVKVDMDAFMKACDMDHDGTMSKAEMLKHMEAMFDKVDTKKAGKLDRKQTEEFLKQLTAPSGA